MGNMSIYENIGRRTGGDIYMGVVGPVRAGKSTFIKRFMDLMVLPNVNDSYEKQRILDEMPQSGSGRTITTTEPKFIPAEAVNLQIGDSVPQSAAGTMQNAGSQDVTGTMSLKIRLVDCVGYMIPGALGDTEDGEPRMVATPWEDEKLPFAQAAEIGTEKVIKEHSTVGIVITTDGTIDTLGRDAYRDAEEKVIRQLFDLRKPFVVIMNSTEPEGMIARREAGKLSDKYGVPVIRMDCAKASEGEIIKVMSELLSRFPVSEVVFNVPGYIDGLGSDHWLKSQLIENIKYWAHEFETIEELKGAAAMLADGQIVKTAEVRNVDMGTGEAEIWIEMAEELYLKVISELMGETVDNDYRFFELLREFADAKKAYDKLRSAIDQVEHRGYGIVEPDLSGMVLEEPEVFRQGSRYGIKIKAKAPTMHMIRTDITTEVSPLVGSEKQSEELVESLKKEMAESPAGIWDTNFFGKTLHEMVAEQMENKIAAVPDNIRGKMQKSLQKISDEGKEYFICIVI